MKPHHISATLLLAAQGFAYAAAPCPQYQADLLEMSNKHQAAFESIRTYSSLQAGIEALQTVDRRNAEKLGSLLNTCGWPRLSVEGTRAVASAFAIARLSVHDLPFQKRVLALLESAALIGEASTLQFAYLSDQVAVQEGRAQAYGTQLVPLQACKFDYAPLDERSKVEARRRDLRLQPLDDFLTMVNDSAASNGCSSPAAP